MLVLPTRITGSNPRGTQLAESSKLFVLYLVFYLLSFLPHITTILTVVSNLDLPEQDIRLVTSPPVTLAETCHLFGQTTPGPLGRDESADWSPPTPVTLAETSQLIGDSTPGPLAETTNLIGDSIPSHLGSYESADC